MFLYIKRSLNQIIFDHRIWVVPCISDKQGENNRIKGVYAVFRCGCEAVFHWNDVLFKNSDQL